MIRMISGLWSLLLGIRIFKHAAYKLGCVEPQSESSWDATCTQGKRALPMLMLNHDQIQRAFTITQPQINRGFRFYAQRTGDPPAQDMCICICIWTADCHVACCMLPVARCPLPLRLGLGIVTVTVTACCYY
jgi:hypothetical protein